MNIALVTGASSGLGRAFARELSRESGLDQIWLVARRRERMEELAAQLPIPARVLSLDLLRQEDIASLSRLLAEEEPTVSILINCAGFGKIGKCADLTLQETDDMIDLNCRAAVALTTLCLPHMKRGCRILQVASTAAFQPLPGMGVYAATKAFLLRYTRALRWEVVGRGIRVTALCPGWIDTEFIAVARDTKNGWAVNHIPFRAKPSEVAATALRGNRLGLAVVTPGVFSTVQRLGAKLLPACLVMAAWEGLRRL